MNTAISITIVLFAAAYVNAQPGFYRLPFRPYVFPNAPAHFQPYIQRPYNIHAIQQFPAESGPASIEAQLGNPRYKIVCYYESWAVNRPEKGQFRVNDVNPLMCTHLIYSYAKIDEPSYTVKSLDELIDVQGGNKVPDNQPTKGNDTFKWLIRHLIKQNCRWI